MKLEVFNSEGKSTGKEVELDEAIFNVTPNETLIYEAVRSYLANQRQGTAKTKTRSEVTGSTRKLYRQKGTGNARRGNIKSPLLRKGGTAFGPQPREYSLQLTKKMRKNARRSALSIKAQNEGLRVIEDLSFEAPKTRQITSLLDALQLSGKKVLLLTAGSDNNVYRSTTNLKRVQCVEAGKPSTYHIMHADVVVMTESALPVLQATFQPKAEVEAAE